MKLALVAGLSALALFVGTLPHAVGAMFSLPTLTFPTQDILTIPCQASIETMKQSAKKIGKEKVMDMYNNKNEWLALYTLWNRESRWDYTAQNPKSSAFGIPQVLNMPIDTPMIEQINLGLKYIEHRYGSPIKALAFHNIHGWY